MKITLIKHARLVNDGQILEADLRIEGLRISHIGSSLSATAQDKFIEANPPFTA